VSATSLENLVKWRVLVTAPYLQPVLSRYQSLFDKEGIELIVPTVHERLEEGELLPLVSDIDGAICGDDQFTSNVLFTAKRLKVISKWGTGVDSIDRKTADALGVAVRNTPGAFTDAVADTVLGYILLFARKLSQLDRDVRAGRWTKEVAFSLKETTLGVIGVGRIGREVVKRAAAFGLKLCGNDIVEVPQEFSKEHHLTMLSKDELLRAADFVSLNCDLNPTSYHLMGEREFSIMKPTAHLINTARGPIVDERALIAALGRKQIAGAALDVFEKEPLPEDSQLRKFDNVMLAPHNANSSPVAWEYVHRNTIDMLISELLNLPNHANESNGR
jgi:D-3-phosphoglycerate dehydrogenase